MNQEQNKQLYLAVLEDYTGYANKKELNEALAIDPYLNALQIKFAYAITCHKSQGGQWNTVFVEQPYMPNGIDKEYLRWLYTAVTRAKSQLYLIGFKSDFFLDSE